MVALDVGAGAAAGFFAAAGAAFAAGCFFGAGTDFGIGIVWPATTNPTINVAQVTTVVLQVIRHTMCLREMFAVVPSDQMNFCTRILSRTTAVGAEQ